MASPHYQDVKRKEYKDRNVQRQPLNGHPQAQRQSIYTGATGAPKNLKLPPQVWIQYNRQTAAPSDAEKSRNSRKTGTTSKMYFPGKTANNAAGDFCKGMIIEAPHFVPNLDPDMREDDYEYLESKQTGPICAKFRPMVVLGVSFDSLLCAPLMTRGGKYLQKARPCEWAGVLWICNAETRADVPPSVPENRILTSSINLRKPSVVYPSHPCTILLSYQIDRNKFGCLSASDTEKLSLLYDCLQYLSRNVSVYRHEKTLNEHWADAAKERKMEKLSAGMKGMKVAPAKPMLNEANDADSAAWSSTL